MNTTRFTFQYDYTNDDNGDYVTVTTEGTKTIYELLEKFEDFLYSAGYRFNGHLEFVEEPSEETYKFNYEEIQPISPFKLDDINFDFDSVGSHYYDDVILPQSSEKKDIIRSQDC